MLQVGLHHGQLLEASITVSRYIDACLLPFHPLFSFHTQSTTSFNLHTLKHQQPSLDSLNPLYYPTIIYHLTTNSFSQCLPWSNSLLALVLPQTGLFLLFPSESSITSDDSEQSQHHHTYVSRRKIVCTPDVHSNLFIHQLPTSGTAPALT